MREPAITAEAEGEEAALIARIARRVRAQRARLGMSRKALSELTGISERYLAQLEGAQANASITLLARIGRTLGLRLEALLAESDAVSAQGPEFAALLELVQALPPERQSEAHALLLAHFGRQRSRGRRVALVGLRGAGKSTLGRILAEVTGAPFVRLSDRIAEQAGMDTAELMGLFGPAGYRRVEREALREVADGAERLVLETGGGLVAEPETFAFLLERFFTVWIKASPEEHMGRVRSQGDLRPMSGNRDAMDDLRRILTEREGFYRLSDAVIDTSGRTIQACADELIERCRPVLAGKMQYSA